MPTEDRFNLTELIHQAERGDAVAADRLFAATYRELRRLARGRLRAGGRNAFLDTSSLVHESYLRFVASEASSTDGSGAFHAVDRPGDALGHRGFRPTSAG